METYNYYQPIVDGKLKPVGFEVLLRGWINGNLISTEECLKTIKKNNQTVNLALTQISECVSLLDSIPDVFFSINITDDFILSPVVLPFLERIEYAKRACIQFEIPEQMRVSDSHELIKNAIKIRELGYSLSLDDFFSHESSTLPFVYLDIEYVKIDISAIKLFRQNKRVERLLRSAIYYCNISGCTSIAEGVEEFDVFYELKGLGINLFQGYLFSKAISKSDLISKYQLSGEWITHVSEEQNQLP
ncbi:EAL domain-containing protein [Klebsiella sp. BIGb0407]|uniref:EAL domain-containing protein n=1 Tax=Klebsiella sp. BIGb0407 TaxID=2940603 RepID=UPI00216A5B54|nr:EAL domain-containing protein [Klebsiella sp. BIGb0407]MCS3432681.1 EAL domain-containing protein (putative c-di-GMP-specific phosphodiesterase class I) [Klebsiella sp. BIGb0407]